MLGQIIGWAGIITIVEGIFTYIGYLFLCEDERWGNTPESTTLEKVITTALILPGAAIILGVIFGCVKLITG
jgi:hypothetical protein